MMVHDDNIIPINNLPGKLPAMLHILLTIAVLGSVTSQVLIDLSKATLDEETGNFCVTQKVGQFYIILKI